MSSGVDEYWFVFQNEQLVVAKNNDISTIISIDNVSHLKSHFVREYLIYDNQKQKVYCAELSDAAKLNSPFQPITLRSALELFTDDWYTLAAKAYSIISWDKNHLFCGRCGAKTLKKPEFFERVCPQCDLIFYPRISPSIIVRITRGDEILMARGPHFPKGAYALIAGFIEPGENIESAVQREVFEEVNIKIKNLKYFGSQSWPFPDSLMIAFTAEYDSKELQINSGEIEDAGWYRYDQLPGRPTSHISISAKLIDDFIERMENV